MMDDLKTAAGNFLGAGWTAAMLLELLEGGVALLGGAAIIWYNVEKALQTRKARKQNSP